MRMEDGLFRVACTRTVKQTISTKLIRNSSELEDGQKRRLRGGRKNRAGRKKPEGGKASSRILDSDKRL